MRERYRLIRAESLFAIKIVKGGDRRTTARRLSVIDGTACSHLSKIFDKPA